MINALIAAAALASVAAEPPENQPCSEEATVHVNANHHACAWIAPPPFQTPGGGSDYSGLSGTFRPLSITRRSNVIWQLSSGSAMPFDEITASTFEAEKTAMYDHYTSCSTPEAVERLGEEVALQRAHQAFDCWRFLQNDRVRRKDEPVIEDRYDEGDAETEIAF